MILERTYFHWELTPSCTSYQGVFRNEESFFKNMLENIAKEILLLEVNSEDYMSVNQYSFSNEKDPKIKKVNVTNYENEDYNSLIPPSEPQENDYFREPKKVSNLQIFKSVDY